MEIMTICSEIHTKHINTRCGKNVELLNVKVVVHIVTTVRYIYIYALQNVRSLARSTDTECTLTI